MRDTIATTREQAVARFYDFVKFGLTTPTPESTRFIGEHLLGQVGLRPEDLHGQRVLEVGTGRGNWTSVLSTEAAEYQGIDLSPRTVEFIRSQYTADIRVGNIKALPFEGERFDLTFGIGVLPAVEGDRAAFAELVRVTRSGGRIYLMGYGRVFPRNLFRDGIRLLTGRWNVERQAKLCHRFTRLASWPIPDNWMFRGDQLYAQLDWYFAPIQNRHTLAQLVDWCTQEGLVIENYLPYPHGRPMRFHEWAAHRPLIGRRFSPDYFLIVRKS